MNTASDRAGWRLAARYLAQPDLDRRVALRTPLPVRDGAVEPPATLRPPRRPKRDAA